MRWDAVIQAVATTLAADPALADIYGTDIVKSGTLEFRVPLLEYTMLSTGMDELWEPMVIQLDQFTRSVADLATSDRRLHSLFDHEEPRLIAGIYMWASFEEGGDLTGPSREGYHGMASRFRFTPVRQRRLRS